MFNRVKTSFKKKSTFDLSHSNKLSCKMGYLIPFLNEEVVPGDVFNLKTNFICRLMPQLAPIMDNITVYTNYFFVPYRQIWKNWESFITRGEHGNDTSVPPYMLFSNETMGTSTLADYLGVPSTVAEDVKISALPFRAVAKIYNDYFRDQNLIDEVPISLEDGEDTTTNTELLRRAWSKDLFTSALPSTQKGAQASIPLTGNAEVVTSNSNPTRINLSYAAGGTYNTSVGYRQDRVVEASVGSASTAEAGMSTNLEADLSNVTAVNILDLRRASSLQRIQELLMRGGSRYVEYLKSFFGVNNGDLRLQRAQYLGGGTTPIIISEVLQNSQGTQTSPQGNMSGHGFAVANSNFNGFKHKFTEFGLLIGFISVMPKASYYQGLPKKFSKETAWDYLNPMLQHVGEDAIKNKELFASSSDPDGVFGFQRKYYEYTDRPSSIHGDFRESLKFWHMARDFENEPRLNSDFINSDPTTRVFAVESGDTCLFDIYNTFYAKRCLDKYDYYKLS